MNARQQARAMTVCNAARSVSRLKRGKRMIKISRKDLCAGIFVRDLLVARKPRPVDIRSGRA
jgi:hypothetical protein